LRLLAAIVAALVLATGAAAHGPRVIGIGQKQNGETAEVHQGDTLVLSLPASPRTGSWRITAVNRRLLVPNGTGYVPAAHPPLAQGATGVAVFIFRVAATGSTTLKLDYASGKAGKTFSVQITVKAPD
jgi:predicted secreted protein